MPCPDACLRRVADGEHLAAYRAAHGLLLAVCFPPSLVACLARLVHWWVAETKESRLLGWLDPKAWCDHVATHISSVGVHRARGFLDSLSQYWVSLDYLLQVSSRDHWFDNSRIHADFPKLALHEERSVKCFTRIRDRSRKLSPSQRRLGWRTLAGACIRMVSWGVHRPLGGITALTRRGRTRL